MAIILDLPEYRTLTGLNATTDAARDAALQSILNEVNDALTLAIRQPLNSATYTEYYNAPTTDRIALRQWPVSSVTTVKVAQGSNGDPAKFTSDTLLDQYTDWILEVDQSNGTSRSGILRNVNGWWGVSYTRPVGRLASRIDPDYRAVQVVYVAGYVQIPQSLKSAALLMTSRLFHMRKFGLIPGSASLNGASYSLQQMGNATGLLSDPAVQDFLKPFQEVFVGGR